MYKIKYIVFLMGIVLFAQCEVGHKDFEPSAGTADFSNYVALGDSYSAGYTDGALGRRGQEASFPNIIATQLASVGNKGFRQPLVASDGSIGSAGNGYYELKVVGGSLSPVPGAGDVSILADPAKWVNGQFHNIGVPGAKSFHLLAAEYGNPALGAGNFNPFYARFASSPGVSTMVSDAVSNSPSFATLWIGGNDVLGYALEGGENENGEGITPGAIFEASLNGIVSNLFGNDTKGAIANIPNIGTLPYFTAIAYNALEIDQSTADLLNAGYAEYNAGSEALGLPKIEFVAGKNALVIADADYAHPGKIRQMTAGEKVLLPALSSIRNPETAWGSQLPIGEEYVLDEQEVANIDKATSEFNAVIKTLADNNDLAFVDLNELMKLASTEGVWQDGNVYTSTFVSGGTFSLDGIHTTGRGSAIIANEFIKAINKKYEANVPMANVNDYEGVTYP